MIAESPDERRSRFAWHPRLSATMAAPSLEWAGRCTRLAVAIAGAEAAGKGMTRGVLALLLPRLRASLSAEAPVYAPYLLLAEGWLGYAPMPTLTVKGRAAGESWEPHDQGEPLEAMPVLHVPRHPLADAPIVDVLAWRADKPEKVFQRVGLIESLGGELLTDERPRVHASVARWAAETDGRGVWIERRAIGRRLAHCEGALCDDDAHAESLYRHLRASRPALPKVFVEREQSNQAA
jgi:hypothetical protein